MLRKINAHLGIKLFIFLTIIIILAVVPLSYIALQSLINYGSEASESNEQQIRFQAISYLQRISQEKAERYQEYFNRIEASTALLGKQATTIYSDLLYYAENPLYTPRFSLSATNNIWLSDKEDPVLSGYWGAEEIGREALQELYAITHMKPLLLQAIQDIPEAIASHTILMSGMFQYASNNEDTKQAVFNLPPASVHDLRKSEAVSIFAKNEENSTDVRWTEIYKSDTSDDFILTASAPIYDTNGVIYGIAGVDIPLASLVEETLTYNRTQVNNIVQFSFLLDQQNKIIALPEQYYELLGISIDRSSLIHSSQKLDASLYYSSNENVLRLADDLLDSESYFSEINLQDDMYYIVANRMTKQGWIFGIVVKEHDLLYSVEGSRQALDATVKNLVKKGTLLTLVTILIALAIVYILIIYLIKPLRTLADATQRVASGDLTVRSPVSTSDEAGVLSQSFNSMVERLQIIQDEQERYAESLKLEVIRRNLELVSKKNELENTIELLNREVERRQIISEALRNSQKQYYDTLESSTAGIYIIEDGKLTYVNNSFANTIFQSPREELIGTNPLRLVSQEDRQLASMNMQRRLQGADIPPYTIKCVRKDGTTFHAEVWSKVSTWQDKKVMVGTISDVSSIKRKERKIEIQDRQLQKSLDEKEILLKEIYHRTKNNMLVIISMLDLQAQDIDDERLKLIFQETENRIRTMALVHEKLYQSQNLSEIDMGSYLIEVANSLLGTMVINGNIRLKTAIEPIAIDIDYAVPLGLVINEIVTNSIKHAFPENQNGIIYLNIAKTDGGRILLTIGDNGIGLPTDIDIANNTSFGLGIIINSLVKMQLRGEIEVDCVSGTRYQISFPEPKAAQRI